MMSLVGGYPQPFRTAPDPGCYTAQYYGGRFDQGPPPPTAAAADSSYQLGWSFGGYSPDTSVGDFSPHHQGCVPMIGGAGPGSGIDYCMTAGTQPRVERGFKRRVTANRKERRRTLSINNAFAELRECIPNVPSDTKLSKIKTLRLATSYIAYLMDILAQDDPTRAPQGGFKAELSKKLESREERRKREIANLLPNTNNDKKSKGRTGWPQHVWALELKHDP